MGEMHAVLSLFARADISQIWPQLSPSGIHVPTEYLGHLWATGIHVESPGRSRCGRRYVGVLRATQRLEDGNG